AAARLDVSSGELEVKFGIVRVRADMTKSASYAELIGDQEFHLKLDKNAPLKKPAEYTVVGKSLPRPDVPAKVTGEHTYMHDFRVPGMLHARVVGPPALGAQLTGVDESSIGSIKGLMRVVRLGNFLAVVAETEWAAIKAAERLKSSGSAWEGLPEMDKLYQVVRATPVAKDEITVNVGDPKSALASAAKTLAATYEFAIHAHGSIVPSFWAADARRAQGRARRRREHRRLAVGVLDPQAQRDHGRRAADRRDPGRPAPEGRDQPGQHLPELGAVVSIPERPRARAPARNDAVPSFLDPHARAHAEHLCERGVHGRAGGGGRRRPGRVPPAAPQGPARPRGAQGGGHGG